MDTSEAADTREQLSPSLGPLFGVLPTRVLRRYFWPYVDVPQLLTLAETCWTIFVQCNDECLWRSRCLSSPYVDDAQKEGRFTFCGSWKHTVCTSYYGKLRWQRLRSGDSAGTRDESCDSVKRERNQQLLQTCDTLAEVSWRFNALLPRIVACLHRDGFLGEDDYALWRKRADSRELVEIAAETGRSRLVVPDMSSSSATSTFELVRWWQEHVIGKPYAPALASHYLHLSTGAINYFVQDGSFLRPPPNALRRDPQRKATRRRTEFSSHNWAGACLLDLVPLPPWCTVETFLATMAWQSGWLSGDDADANRNAYARLRLPDTQRGVPGVVDRRHRLDAAAFRDQYETPNTPVVLTGCIEDWSARREWEGVRFFHKFCAEPLKANGRTTSGRRFRMSATDYAAYETAVNGEKPMYIFDKKVLSRCSALSGDYSLPPYFKEDLFATMEEEDRPDYRWVLVGPDGSGTPFHTDPHGTSAWNAVLSGCKRVTLYPPHVVPPGVEEKWIHSDYYASEPYLRWYRERVGDLPAGAAVRAMRSSDPHVAEAVGGGAGAAAAAAAATADMLPVEALVFPGDLIFIPSGWWHQVLNIGHTAAVTQNFCSRVTFPRVARDMNAYADRQVLKDFQLALRRAGYDELAVQLRVPASA